MIYITNGCDTCEFSEYTENMMPRERFYKYCIRINGMMIINIPNEEYGNYNLLNETFAKFCRYNYKPFWRNPFAYIFGRKKCYDWNKIRYS